jgi:membrane fusion protein (multidrug efflux system)
VQLQGAPVCYGFGAWPHAPRAVDLLEGRDGVTTAEANALNGADRGSWIRRWRWPLMLAGPAVILGLAAYFYFTSGRFEETDNAYVQAGRAPISTSIAGRVIEVDVKENQRVKAGQVLFRLDPDDVKANLRQAEATLAAARQQVSSLSAGYERERVAVETAQRTFAFAQREAARQRALVDAGVSSRQQLDEAVHTAELARQQVATAKEELAQAQANLGGGAQSNAAVLQAMAQVEKARLDLSHTVIIAPQDGIAARVEQLQVGAYVNPAQTLFWLISGAPWVEANFKENQLRKMRVGQPADIRIDAYGGQQFAGHVASFSPGTGAIFSALPAQNATGNWVKVVQRLPVRVAFDKPPPDMAGRAGLSADVKVDVRSTAQRR